jgi:hypothetical protein
MAHQMPIAGAVHHITVILGEVVELLETGLGCTLAW